MVLIPVGAAVAAAVQLGALGAYLTATAPLRGRGRSVSSFFAAAWENGMYRDVFAEAWRTGRDLLGKLPGMIAAGVAVVLLFCVIAIVVIPVGTWAGDYFGLPFGPGANFAVVAVVAVVVGALAVAVVAAAVALVARKSRPGLAQSLKTKGPGLALAANSLLILVLYGGFFYLLRLLADLLEESGVASLVVRAVAVVASVLAVLALAVCSWLMFRALVQAVLSRRPPYPPDTFTPKEWVEKVARSDADGQDLLLARTTHQSLSLTAEEFLNVLKDLRTSIKEEPALSTYWKLREELQLVLKQEKHD